MKTGITRGIVILAAVSVAVGGAVSTAAAYELLRVDVIEAAHGVGTRMFVVQDCAVASQRSVTPRFEVLLNVDNSGAGSQGQDNVNWLQVIALDEDNDPPWDYELAEVEAMRVEYIGYRGQTTYRSLARMSARDGVHMFAGERNNVDKIKIRVRWYEFGRGEDETLQCNLDLPDTV